MNLGWFCMSWRQPAHANAAKPMASSREMGWTRKLIVHLHHRDGPKALQEGTRFQHIELGIVGFETEKEFVHRGPGTEIWCIEQGMVQGRQPAHGQHAEGGG